MSAYYNEIDPYAAQWLRNLIESGHIAPGDVDERSIVDIKPAELRGYEQCHFFAGIGGWSIALRLAGWPDDRPVWTGSCPCQPFSAAGAGKAADDERHLWPAWFPLIQQLRPAIVFGEQVEAAVGWGWLDAVFADLENEGYACGAAVLPACGVGAPHKRYRAWFVADADGGDASTERLQRSGEHRQRAQDSCAGELANAPQRDQRGHGGKPRSQAGPHGGEARQTDGDAPGGSSRLGHANGAGRTVGIRHPGNDGAPAEQSGGQTAEQAGHWGRVEWLYCIDGNARPTQPGLFPLAHGVQRRTSKLRAYGNAIVPQVAAEFIRATQP